MDSAVPVYQVHRPQLVDTNEVTKLDRSCSWVLGKTHRKQISTLLSPTFISSRITITYAMTNLLYTPNIMDLIDHFTTTTIMQVIKRS
jgi:hypothetical protein